MEKLLFIQASPRGQRSKSVSAASAFISAYQHSHEEVEVVSLNVFDMDLPSFDGPAIEAKYAIMHSESPDEQQQLAWKTVEQVIEQFKSADKYVFAVPMWNFGIPYRLKQYFDVIVQPGYTFDVDESGYAGLVEDRPVFIAYARGGDYPPEKAEQVDYQKRYMELILGFIGLSSIQSVIVQHTLMQGPDAAEQKLQEAVEKAREIAAGF